MRWDYAHGASAVVGEKLFLWAGYMCMTALRNERFHLMYVFNLVEGKLGTADQQ